MNFTDWARIQFPVLPSQPNGEVYVLFYLSAHGETPFYVGQTVRFNERMGDYQAAQFAASTDFKVGQVIKYLTNLGYRVVARHKASGDRRTDERDIIKSLAEKGFNLLNSLEGYDYRKADRSVESAQLLSRALT
jgi:hypothetical protein